MMFDVVEKWRNTTIQHGPENNRVYIIHLSREDFPEIIGAMDALAEEKGYEKIFAKVPATLSPGFEMGGYRREAFVPGFYRGLEDAVFLSKYLRRDRGVEKHAEEMALILKGARDQRYKPPMTTETPLPGVASCQPADVEEMSRLFKKVYRSYPFPIFDPSYLSGTMAGRVRYFCVRKGGEMVAIGSAEMDRDHLIAEMTDFATLPGWRGQGLARRLLVQMESYTALEGIKTAFTIARALSVGINRVFAGERYLYAGTLTNNTQISGHIESMNVWYKPLKETGSNPFDPSRLPADTGRP